MKISTRSSALLCALLILGVAGLAWAEGPKDKVLAAKVKQAAPGAEVELKKGAMGGDRLMYTTYFYTANEAVIHGYEKGTNARIVDLERGGTIWQGKVDNGQTKLVKTGRGVFGFLSDKKASLLVGTPSRCAVVGYWVRDREGSFRSDHLYSQLPSQTHFKKEKVIIWAWDDANVKVTNTSTEKTLFSGKIKKGEFHEIPASMLQSMHNHVLHVSADKKNVSVQVYYDEGFFVPGSDGRASGRLFRTFVGDTTTGQNDLQLFAYGIDTKVKVRDIKANKVLFEGVVKGDTVHTMTMANKYVEITSQYEISAAVAPYEHYKSAYQEHHFGAGQEGTGIEGNFLITTPQELWVFSYYDKNPVTVTNMKTNQVIWKGNLDRGKPINVNPGHGFYRVRSAKGTSVMGGAMACGAEFSPAGGLFKVDEALFKVVKQLKAERIERAKKAGKKLTKAQLDAPLTKSEKKRARKLVNQARPAAAPVSEAEVDDRLDNMNTY